MTLLCSSHIEVPPNKEAGNENEVSYYACDARTQIVRTDDVRADRDGNLLCSSDVKDLQNSSLTEDTNAECQPWPFSFMYREKHMSKAPDQVVGGPSGRSR